MPKLFLILTLLFTLINPSLFSVDPENYGLRILNKDMSDGKTSMDLADASGSYFRITYSGELQENTLQTIIQIKDGLLAWEGMIVKNLSCIVTENEIQIVVEPESYTYGGERLDQFMPSGMNFYYGEYLYYNFRMTKDNYFLRITGRWINPEEFGKKITGALNNPVAYIQSQSTEYFSAKLSEHSTEIDNLHYDSEQHRVKIEELTQALAELQSQFQDLSERYDSHVAMFEKLRYAVLKFNNPVLFWTELIPPEGIAMVLELKNENPDLSRQEMMKILREKKIDLSDKEVELIYNVYYNEF